MIDISKVEELITFSDKTFITAHKNIDLDALGSMLGMYYLCTNLGKETYLIVDDSELTSEISIAFKTLKEKNDIAFNKYSEVKDMISNKSLLIITDTNKNYRLQNDKLCNMKNKIVIDHHIKTEDSIENVSYEYVDVDSSSACEMVVELLKNMNIYIPSTVATIMLSGMYIDTNGFLLKTTGKTHTCASMLYEFGANNKEAQYLLKQGYDEFKRRQKLTLATEFYNNVAITTSNDKYLSTELAKTSDVLLTFDGVEASFSIAKLDDNTVGISARSLGNINVEDLMSMFGGGGHITDAAAQIKNKDVDVIKKELLKYLGGLDEGNIH